MDKITTIVPPWFIMDKYTYKDTVNKHNDIRNYFNSYHNQNIGMNQEEKEKISEMLPRPIIWNGTTDAGIIGITHLIHKWPEQCYHRYDDSIKNGEMLGFFGAQNPEDKHISKGCLSQWYMRTFTVDKIEYNCCEQYMMAQKAIHFGDYKTFFKIMNSDSPKEIKRLGREVANFNSQEWDKVKFDIVLTANYCKFSQNKDLRNFLISTGNKVLVEASPYDAVWGIKNSKVESINDWFGENLLGFALMQVRDEIHRVYDNCNKFNFIIPNKLK